MPIFLLSGLLFLTTVFAPSKIVENQNHSIVSRAEAEQVAPLGLKAKGMYVENADTGESLISYNEDKKWSIASLTKLTTALVYLEQNPDLEKVITFEKDDFVGGATLRVPVGTKLKAIDLLHSSLMSSANNSTQALARSTNLSYEQFIERMNQKARDLGLENTRFIDPTGLEPANVSTPEEYTKLVSQAFANELIHKILVTTHYQIEPLNHAAFPIGNTDKLLHSPQEFEVIGGKTGFTDGSDYNFVTQVKNEEKDVIIVVFGDETFNQAFESAKMLAEESLETGEVEKDNKNKE